MTFFPTRAVFLGIGAFQVHWYGVMYLLAFLVAYALIPRLARYRGITLTKDDLSAVLTAGVIGVIVGGRLGYVLFYGLSYFLADPLEIFAVWHGGMSSHGGFVGVTVALLLTLRKRNIPMLPFADVITVPVAIGLMLGRLGNFINLELYGTVTDLPWAMAIPGVEGLRHPTQIYAMFKDACIALLCFWHLRSAGMTKPGTTLSIFLISYAVLRFIVEHFREQSITLIPVLGFTLTRGQLLTIPILLVGLGLFWVIHRRESL